MTYNIITHGSNSWITLSNLSTENNLAQKAAELNVSVTKKQTDRASAKNVEDRQEG